MSLATPGEEEHALVFLVVVDETPELRVALRYACRRAKRTGGRKVGSVAELVQVLHNEAKVI